MSENGKRNERYVTERFEAGKSSQLATILLGFVDKSVSERHPFVDMVLTFEFLTRFEEVKVYRSLDHKTEPRSEVDHLLYPRRGIYRYINFFKVLFTVTSQIRAKSSGALVLFVRNEPVYLAGCVIGKLIARLVGVHVQLVFQSSFPHESYSGHLLQRVVARLCFRLCFLGVDRFIAVSQLGLERLSNYSSRVCSANSYAIPLLSEYPQSVGQLGERVGCALVRLVYVGSLKDDRQFGQIYRAYVEAKERVPELSLTAFGIVPNQRLYPEVEFRGFVERKVMLAELSNFDVGICLIPPEPQFQECSPTKLGDYIQEGVVPLCSGDIAGLKELSNMIYPSVPTPCFGVDEISSAFQELASWSSERADAARIAVTKFHRDQYNYEAKRCVINEALYGIGDLH